MEVRRGKVLDVHVTGMLPMPVPAQSMCHDLPGNPPQSCSCTFLPEVLQVSVVSPHSPSGSGRRGSTLKLGFSFSGGPDVLWLS